MNKCSSYDYIQFKYGILDGIVDAVYVMLLKNSNRTETVYRDINNLKLSKNNYIQINEKYKDCSVTLCKQNIIYSITNSMLNILNHANKMNYNNILILEDDFMFSNDIKNRTVIKDLEHFINNNDFNLYYLGVLPGLFIPNFMKHFKLLYGGCTHSVIYSKKGRDIIINNYQKDICTRNTNYDIWFNYILNKKYFYYKPLCTQKLIKTDNQQTWMSESKFKFGNYLLTLKYSIFKLDKGIFKYYYIFIYFLHFIIILLIIGIVIFKYI